MEDKIGLALAANRIGISMFYNDEIEKSTDFHKINLQVNNIILFILLLLIIIRFQKF